MKKIKSCMVTALVLVGTFVSAGGDIEVVEKPATENSLNLSGVYFGLGFTDYTMDANGNFEDNESVNYPFGIDSGTSMTTFIVGYQINENFAIEGRYIPQYTTLDFSLEGDTLGLEFDTTNVAIYLKPMYPLGDVTLYGLLGYGQTSLKFKIDQLGSETLKENSFQWGAGAAYALSEHTNFFVDYTVMYDGSDFDGMAAAWNDNLSDTTLSMDFKISAITAGLTYKF